jgi:hypothetical protein
MDQNIPRVEPSPENPMNEDIRRLMLGQRHRICLLHKLFFYAPRGMTFAHLTDEEITDAIIDGEIQEGSVRPT